MADASPGRLSFTRDGADWPNRDASQFVEAAGLRWHVQRMGSGPVALLLHGTAASTHSWRDFAPLLAKRFTVIAPDLPGHAFTDRPEASRMSLPGMADAVAKLMVALDVTPALAVGHSAGAAVLARMAIDRRIDPALLISLNGALLPFRGVAAHVFAPLAKLLVQNTLVPKLFSWRASHSGVVEKLLRDTGSSLDPRGVELYTRLIRNQEHVTGALEMMANWDLDALERDLPRLMAPLVLIVGGDDKTISSEDAFRVRDRVPNATIEYLRGLGHLAHEERPNQLADLVMTRYDSIVLGKTNAPSIVVPQP